MKKENIKIIFMGTPQFAADILSVLLEKSYNVAAIFTQPDKKTGRKQKLVFSPVKETALKAKIEIFQPSSLKEGEAAKNIREISPDLIVVAAYGKILPKEILEIPRFGCLNIHASLLPKFRGASPIQNAILGGEKETGVTLMLMSEKMDAGEILAREKIRIENGDTIEALTKKLSRSGTMILVENIPEWISGKIKLEKQNDKLATFCRPIRREEGLVDWKKTAQEIYDKWRAFHSWPGLYTSARLKNGIKRLKLLEISIDPVAESGEKPGKVIEYSHKSAVQTGKGIVFLKVVQLEGKNAAGIDDFRRGYPDFTVV